ncbi:MAG: hypothetical protein NXH70_17035 [Hyphomonas sp.]|nr:hypothetical protein [Hyphomonas sp.]
MSAYDPKAIANLMLDEADRRGIKMALLHKSADGQATPFPGHTYPTALVTGMPIAVKPFMTATRI